MDNALYKDPTSINYIEPPPGVEDIYQEFCLDPYLPEGYTFIDDCHPFCYRELPDGNKNLHFYHHQHIAQKKIIEFATGQIDSRVLIMSAAAQVGKSSCMAFALWLEILQGGPGKTHLIVGPSLELLASGFCRYFLNVFGENYGDSIEHRVNNQKYPVAAKLNARGSEALCQYHNIPYELDRKGNPKHNVEIAFRPSLKGAQIHGKTCTSVFFDEAGAHDVNPDHFGEIISGRTAGTRGRCYFITTPNDPNGAFAQNMFLKYHNNPKSDFVCFNAPLWWKPHTDMAEMLAEAKETLEDWQYSVKILGLPHMAEGRVYPACKQVNKVDLCPWPIETSDDFVAGIDPGEANLGSTLWAVKIYDNIPHFFLLDTYKYQAGKDATRVLHHHIQAWEKWLTYYGKETLWFGGMGVSDKGKGTQGGDDGGLIKLYNEYGIPVQPPIGKSVRTQIDILNEEYSRQRILVPSKHREFWKEINTTIYDKQGKPALREAHLTDSARYAICGYKNNPNLTFDVDAFRMIDMKF